MNASIAINTAMDGGELSTLSDADLMARYHKLPALRVSIKKYEAEVMAEIKTRWDAFVDDQGSTKERRRR
jgi:hypothetical protein